jgi:serine protease Do
MRRDGLGTRRARFQACQFQADLLRADRVGWRLLIAFIIPAAVLPAAPAAAQEVTGLEAATAVEKVLADVIARNEKSVVAIALFRQPRPGKPRTPGRPLAGIPLENQGDGPAPGNSDFIPSEYGTGVVVDRRGLILTNYHVLGQDTPDYTFEYYVTTSDRKPYKATVKATDPRSDLAVLEIDAHDLSPITLGNADTLKKGHIVIALGNPYAIARDGQASASWGIVSNLARKTAPTLVPNPRSLTGNITAKQTLAQFGMLIQTDAKLNIGTSGGALLNLKGEMIGLTTASGAAAGAEQAAGFAVPVDETFRRVVDTLKQGREVEFGFLGIEPENLSLSERQRDLKGARVRSVFPGTPAEQAGLKAADVITHVNGQAVLDVDDLVLALSRLPVDAVVQLSVLRSNQPTPIQLKLAKFTTARKPIFTVAAPSWRGVRVEYVTAHPDFINRVERSRVPDEPCVYVTEVEENSPAASVGLKPGMFITHVGGTRVQNPKEFTAATTGKTGPVELRLLEETADGGAASARPPFEAQVKTIPAAAN